MNIIIKRFTAFLFSAFLVVLLPFNAANAASNWQPTSAKSSGSRVILGATNGGYKSAINIPPNLAKIAKFGMKGANALALIQIASGLISDGVDFVLDPANNRIKYKDPSKAFYTDFAGVRYNSASSVCAAYGATLGKVFTGSLTQTGVLYYFTCYENGQKNNSFRAYQNDNNEYYLPASDLAPSVATAATQTADPVLRSAAQKILQDVAKAAVIAGDYDADLLAGAVPINDTKPVIPAVPGSQVGDVDAGMTGGDVGAAADAAREAADTARKQSEAAKDAAREAADEARRLNDEAKDLINTSIDQAIKDAAAAAAAQAAKAAADAKSVADAAAVAAADAAKVAADKAVAAAEKSAADARAAADATVESIAAADKAVADARAAAKEAADAAKAVEKPFELPAFCSWATPVCDAVEWLMKPAPDLDDDTVLDIDDTDVMPVDTDINFGGSCPANFEVNSSIFGNPINITLFETSKFCSFLSTFVKFPVYAASSLFALYILGGRKDV